MKLSTSFWNSSENYGLILFENYDESELFYDDEPIVDFLDKVWPILSVLLVIYCGLNVFSSFFGKNWSIFFTFGNEYFELSKGSF